MTSSQANASPLRQRMIDDMRMRHACAEDAGHLSAIGLIVRTERRAERL